jgi:hypothetical protein
MESPGCATTPHVYSNNRFPGGSRIGGLPILTLRNSAKTGLPPKDVLERATQRARELDAREKSAGDGD